MRCRNKKLKCDGREGTEPLCFLGSKVVLYPLLFQHFLFNVMIIRHFNMVKILDMLESGYSR